MNLSVIHMRNYHKCERIKRQRCRRWWRWRKYDKKKILYKLCRDFNHCLISSLFILRYLFFFYFLLSIFSRGWHTHYTLHAHVLLVQNKCRMTTMYGCYWCRCHGHCCWCCCCCCCWYCSCIQEAYIHTHIHTNPFLFTW